MAKLFLVLLFTHLRSAQAATGEKPVFSKWFGKRIEALALSPRGDSLAVKVGTSPIVLYSVKSGREMGALQSSTPWFPNSLAYSPRGEVIGSGQSDGKIRIWNTRSRELIRTLDITRWGICNLAFSGDGTLLAFDVGDGTVQVRSTESWEKVGEVHWPGSRPGAMGFSSDGRWIAIAPLCQPSKPDQNGISIWDWRNEKVARRLASAGEGPFTICPDDQVIMTGGLLRVDEWPVFGSTSPKFIPVPASLSPPKTMNHEGPIDEVIYSQSAVAPDCKTVATLNTRDGPWIWRLDAPVAPRLLASPEASIAGRGLGRLLFSKNGNFLAAGDWNYTVLVWRTKSH